MALITDEKELASLQAAHPTAKRFGKVTFQGRPIYFRNPSPEEFRQFDVVYSQPNQEAQAYHTLALLVTTDRAALVGLLAEWPGLTKSGALVSLLNELSGIGQLEESK